MKQRRLLARVDHKVDHDDRDHRQQKSDTKIKKNKFDHDDRDHRQQ